MKYIHIYIISIIFISNCAKEPYNTSDVYHNDSIKSFISHVFLQDPIEFEFPSPFKEMNFEVDFDGDTVMRTMLINAEKWKTTCNYDETKYIDMILFQLDSNSISIYPNGNLKSLEDSVIIDNTMVFTSEVLFYWDDHCTNEPTYNITNRYSFEDAVFGIELKLNSEKYYGWIRLDMPENKIVIKEYAYNTIPNEPIKAGQKE